MKILFVLKATALIGILSMIFSQNVSASEIQPYGAGTWDPIGYKEILYIQPNNFDRTQIVYSGGGNIKLKFTNATFQTYRVYLYEDDGDGGYDRITPSPKYGKGDCELIWDVSEYVDGTNKKAEIFADVGYTEFSNDYLNVEFFD